MRLPVSHVLALFLLALQASLSFAIRAEIPGRCPETCRTQVESVFSTCIAQVKRGCSLQLCNSPPKSVKCGLRSGFPRQLFTGEQVTFFDFRVSRSMTTDIILRGLRPRTDVYILLDGTGSMGDATAALRRGFPSLTKALGQVGDFAYGVGFYRDETELNMGFRHLQSITTNVNLARESINAIRSKGGDDSEEANLVALWKIATGKFVKWRADAKRIIVLFGDFVGHEPTCFNGEVLNRAVVARALNSGGITVQAIGTSRAALDVATKAFGCKRGPQTAPEGQTTFITTRTEGALTSLSRDNTPSVIKTFSNVIRSSGTIINVKKSTCTEGFRISFDPPLPASIGGNRLMATLRLRRKVCRRGTFQCSISFNSGDFVTAPLTLRARKPAGCPSL